MLKGSFVSSQFGSISKRCFLLSCLNLKIKNDNAIKQRVILIQGGQESGKSNTARVIVQALRGHYRGEHVSVPHARFLLHGVSAGFGQERLEEKQVEERLKGLKIDEENIAKGVGANAGKSATEVINAMRANHIESR